MLSSIRSLGYYFARGGAMLWGVALCGVVLGRHAAVLLSPDVLLLAAMCAGLRRRRVVLRRGSDGSPQMTHIQGISMAAVALLRDGPAAALAVTLLGSLGGVPEQIASLRGRSARGRREGLLSMASEFFLNPALTWLSGVLYFRLGGIPVHTLADSARFFGDPRAVLLPMAAMLVLQTGVGECLYIDLLMFCKRMTLERLCLLDPVRWFSDPIEVLGGALILVLWTAFGWGTVPLTLLVNELLLLSARNYFAHRDARRDAECDPLTGLASWRRLDAVLQERVARAHETRAPLSVLFLDVDGLKRVNDRHGHAAGDDLLRAVGACCAAQARAGDVVGRRGGDEFLLILAGLDRAGAERFSASLQREIGRALAAHPQFAQSAAGASVGLAVFPGDAREAEQLVDAADRRMYADKRARQSARLAAA